MPISAIAVHLFTASGIVCALLATTAMLEGAYERMFVWLGVAFVIDAVDGTFARMARVSERLPRFSGERLDLVIDYVTYVFIPVLALIKAGYLEGPAGLVLAALALLSALFHFSDTESKSEDNCFIGFPAVWNLVAFHVFAFDPPRLATMAVIGLGVVLTFVPWRWVHPLRVAALRPVTLAFTALWGVAAVWCVMAGFPAAIGLKAVLLAVTIYAVGLSLMWRGAPERSEAGRSGSADTG